MGKWLYDRPWIWIVVLLVFLVASGGVVLVIAEMNRPEVIKETAQAVGLMATTGRLGRLG
ncbi:hypothetical protein CSA17_06255 [bacterium DOLJORAL78_65_58]|nr:MAG: hypothetical protein CSB20_12850 [bacterium DOLZORAL124_64_63]PIE75671.1 MAG: hypothetical protein CSA17_06255 [bacterium DOLJORAL78_65_58]